MSDLIPATTLQQGKLLCRPPISESDTLCIVICLLTDSVWNIHTWKRWLGFVVGRILALAYKTATVSGYKLVWVS